MANRHVFGGMGAVHPYILAGGRGTRLWPLSRPERPKPFLSPSGDDPSLLQRTLQRLRRPPFAEPVILCQHAHRFSALRQARECGFADITIILEPEPRNTAASALLAALHCRERHGGDAPLMLVPADQLLEPPEALADAARRALRRLGDDAIVTFGVHPSEPRTDLGYLLIDNSARPREEGADADALAVRRFVEKPDAQQLSRLLAEESPALWNAGVFLATAGDLVRAFQRHASSHLRPCREALRRGLTDGSFLHLDARTWRSCPEGQFDRVIMERHRRVICVPLRAEWSDIGAWPMLHATMQRDENGNATTGNTCLAHTRNSIVLAPDGRGLALLGLSDVIAVAMHDMVLLASMDHAAEVPALARRCGLDTLPPIRGDRPWGSYVCLARGDGFQVKLLHIDPGARLSLQRHAHRAEHWVVLGGRVRVCKDGRRHDIGPRQSIGIPAGCWHRLENPDDTHPAVVMEIQCGDYLEEDDIERREDDYGRC